ncbi:MAG: ABC transporter ATP-binding protein [Candidatus Krumholzibacteriia bacterium]
MALIELKNLTKTYRMGDIDVHALRGVDMKVEEREFLAITGASGSGKSTMLNILGCLDLPSSGEYVLGGTRVNGLDKRKLADIRNEKIGFVFQGFNLLARTSALENVELPLLYDRAGRIKEPARKAVEVLTRVGLADRLHHEPNKLSGGEQQRVAIARALVNEPAILLADEPTGNLDTVTSMEVIDIFRDLNRQGMTIILVTHEPEISRQARRAIELRDGRIIKDVVL